MAECPKYRLRLFLSVDLVGSTAFKARFESAIDGGYQPRWVTQIRHFYREFPTFVTQCYLRVLASKEDYVSYERSGPSTWKTIGDEILFCCRVESLEHISCCVKAFLDALVEYGKYLDRQNLGLDVKGSGWVAAFPAPNITVEVLGVESNEIEDEDFERRADEVPSEFDFLGKSIDSGFRAAKYASSDRFAPSLELAWLLANACHEDFFQVRFSYHGREILKGVIADHPYPIISIDSERSQLRRELRIKEHALLKPAEAQPMNVRDFLHAFMENEGIEAPVLPRHGVELTGEQLPKTYKDFEQSWRAGAQENSERNKTELESAGADGQGGELPEALNAALDAAVARSEN